MDLNSNDVPPTEESFIEFSTGLIALADHEPPVGVGQGSVLIDIPSTVDVIDPPAGGPAPFVYTFRSNRATPSHFTNISGLLVTTERADGFIDVDKYTLPASIGAKLHIWLTDPPAATADLILEAVNFDLQLTISAALNAANPTPHMFRLNRKFRRFCSNSNLHARKWALIRGDGTIVRDPLTGKMLTDASDESYSFYVSFDHTH